MVRRRADFSSKRIIGVISDMAEGAERRPGYYAKDRTQWTSTVALHMGFTRDDYDPFVFRKVFQEKP